MCCSRAIRRLVFGRMTGWGQDGPLAARAGHDIDYIALSGALHAIGRDGLGPRCRRSTSSATSAAAACSSASASCARCSRRSAPGAGRSSTPRWSRVRGCSRRWCGACSRRRAWHDERGVNVLDSGAPWYDTYDDPRRQALRGRRHRAQVLRGAPRAPRACRRSASRAARSRRLARAARALRAVFATKTRDEWSARVRGLRCMRGAGADASAKRRRIRMPQARGAHVTIGDVLQPAPAPRFSRTPGAVRGPPPERGSARSRGSGRLGLRRRRDRALARAWARLSSLGAHDRHVARRVRDHLARDRPQAAGARTACARGCPRRCDRCRGSPRSAGAARTDARPPLPTAS